MARRVTPHSDEYLAGLAHYRLGFGPIRVNRDLRRAMFFFKVETRHLNKFGVVHGGIISAALDSVMTAAFWTDLPKGERNMGTASLTVNFLRPIRKGRLLALGWVAPGPAHQKRVVFGRLLEEEGRRPWKEDPEKEDPGPIAVASGLWNSRKEPEPEVPRLGEILSAAAAKPFPSWYWPPASRLGDA